MFGSAIVGVAIGLVLTYVLMSLLVTQLNNLMVWLLNLRAQVLFNFLRDELLDGELNHVLHHPLLDITYPETRQPRWQMDYVSPTAFANALSTASIEKVTRTLEANVPEEQRAQLGQLSSQLMQQLQDPTLTIQHLESLKTQAQQLQNETARRVIVVEVDDMLTFLREYQATADFDGRLALLQREVQHIKSYPLRTSLSLVLKSIDKFDNAIEAIAGWFDTKIDETSQIYARYLATISFVIGLTAAIVLNVDTIYIATTLWSDTENRDSVVASANVLMDELEIIINELEQPTEDTPQGETSLEDIPIDDVQNTLDLLEQTDLPIWWGENNRFISISRVFGWVVTAVATTLGAPFWFDVLRKIAK